MTAAQLKSILSIVPSVKSVIASGASNRNEIPFTTDDKTIAYDTGIPKDPYAKSVEEGGKRVLIGDMNAVSNVATTGIFIRQNGGTNEFDERVVLIDKGTKVSGSWGYPKDAIIDWWDGTTFKKVICIKSDGNCTYSPDDSVHGVNGSGDKYWQIVNRKTRKKYTWESKSWSDTSVVVLSSGTYTFQTMCKAFLRISYNIRNNHGGTNVNSTGYMYVPIVARGGDTLSIGENTITFNGVQFKISSSMFTTYRSYVIVSGISIDVYSIYAYVQSA